MANSETKTHYDNVVIYQYQLDWMPFVASVLRSDDAHPSRVYASARQGHQPVSLIRVTITTLIPNG